MEAVPVPLVVPLGSGGRLDLLVQIRSVGSSLFDEPSLNARDLTFTIEPASGVFVDGILGHAGTVPGQASTVRLEPVLEEADLLIRLHYDSAASGSLPIGKLRLRFVDLLDGGVTAEVELSPVVRASDDAFDLENTKDEFAQARVEEIVVADLIQTELARAQMGKFEAARSALQEKSAALRASVEADPFLDVEGPLDALATALEEIERLETDATCRTAPSRCLMPQ